MILTIFCISMFFPSFSRRSSIWDVAGGPWEPQRLTFIQSNKVRPKPRQNQELPDECSATFEDLRLGRLYRGSSLQPKEMGDGRWVPSWFVQMS